MINKRYLVFLFCLLSSTIWAQSLKVIDAKTMEPIPFFHMYDTQKSKVLLGGPEGSVSLEDLLSMYTDSLYISHLGYETISLKKRDLDISRSEILIKLQPVVFNLEEASAQILEEEELFIRFQIKLKDQLSQNSWLVRVHFWEFIDGSPQLIDQYGLMGFGGLIERKGKFGKYDQSNYFLLSEYARKNTVNESDGWHSTKNLMGVLLNEILTGIVQTKPKKVSALSSSREKLTYAINYVIDELNIELMISEDAELLEIKWKESLDLNIADSIQFETGNIKFHPDSELLVPISVNLKFENLASKQQHEVYLLSSFIPSPVDYRVFLSENYALDNYYRLMVILSEYDDYSSESSFFQSSKAQFESKKMAQFSGKSLNENTDWVEVSAKEEIGKRNIDEAGRAKITEFYEYKISLLNEFKKLGLTW